MSLPKYWLAVGPAAGPELMAYTAFRFSTSLDATPPLHCMYLIGWV